MAEIVLTTLRCPDAVPVEQRRVTTSELRIGRGEGCDWRLADPSRALSKEHCVLEFHQGGWQVRDLSSNGTFVNDARAPVGRDQVHPLRSGDRLRIGPYEIELQDAQARAGSHAPATPAFPGAPFAPPAFEAGPIDVHAAHPNPFDEPSFFRPDEPAPPAPIQSDPTLEEFQAFTPPAVQPKAYAFPDDLDLSLDGDPSSRSAAAAPQAPFGAPARPAATADLDFAPDPGPPPAQPAADMEPPQPLRRPPPPHAPAAAPAPSGGGLDDFIAGADLTAGLSDRVAADPAATLRTAGALLRRITAGLRDLLIARNSVKQEFRIQQTLLHASQNNPVKFAATDEQTLAALLDPKVPALKAVDETLDDLIRHQLATLEATQAAARSLLERMSPAAIEAEDPGGGLLPGSREKRLWESYRKRHAQLVEDFNDDFESAFGKAFARAYEESTRGRDT